MEIVKLEHVTKIYGEGDTRVWGLDDVSLTIDKGEIVSIVGASGSGKSTLLHVMGGVDTPNSGNVIVDGRDITTLSDEEMSVFRRRKIGFVFQSYHLIPVLTVEENINMPILLDHRKPDREYIDHVIEMLGIKDRKKHLPSQLSGGQQQRVAIARALVMKPDILCFDEPTSALDPELTGEVLKVIRNLAENNTTMIIVTHEMAFARDVADQVIFMDDGYVVEAGDPKEVINNPKEERTRQFLSRYTEG